MNKRLLLFAASALLIALGSVNTAWAQGSTGMLDGQIVDSSGNGVADVSITVSNTRTGLTRNITTNAAGNFKMQLPPGPYSLQSSKSGLNTVEVEQFAINLGATTNLTIPVEASALEEIITYGTVTARRSR
jgi:hypothetical protein